MPAQTKSTLPSSAQDVPELAGQPGRDGSSCRGLRVCRLLLILGILLGCGVYLATAPQEKQELQPLPTVEDAMMLTDAAAVRDEALWQCLLLDDGVSFFWCGTEHLRSPEGDLYRVRRQRPGAPWPGCLAGCHCCMQAWPEPGPDAPFAKPAGIGEAKLRDVLMASAERTFQRVLLQYWDKPWSLPVTRSAEMLQVATALPSHADPGQQRQALGSAGAVNGSVVLVRDLKLSGGVARRGYILLNRHELPSADDGPVEDIVKFNGRGLYCAEGGGGAVQSVDRYGLNGFPKDGTNDHWTAECRRACIMTPTCTHYTSAPQPPLRDCLLYTGGCDKGLPYEGQRVTTYQLKRETGDAATFKETKLRFASKIPAYCPRHLWGLFPVWTAALEAMARQAAVDGKVIFTMADGQYKEALSCWHFSVKYLMEDRVGSFIVPTDAATMTACNQQALPCVVVDEDDLPHIHLWGDIGFIKFYAMAVVARLGLTFIFSEMDVVLLKDPWPHHEKEDGLQWSEGDCRHYEHPPDAPGRHPVAENERADVAEIQVGAHYNHPRANIGYIYVRSTPRTLTFLLQLIAYFVGKCPDGILGYDRKPNTFVDLGLPDQNIFDAFLRNVDHHHPKYKDIPWGLIPRIPWKLLDFNTFGIFGKTDEGELVTLHYAGEGRKVPCWAGICNRAKKGLDTTAEGQQCLRQWIGAPCRQRQAAERSLQPWLAESCLAQKIACSVRR
eukprot:TRINITY_DN46875_c0_g1_i1.p1 TRINITY_DN46875_c0_g1~~TRINITY_DN46875_c0_g1_i1.p1  ORF type:complete len:725 (+),score=143.85 TRINITY_DN46875_c0_g1_i1:99-2273(+)